MSTVLVQKTWEIIEKDCLFFVENFVKIEDVDTGFKIICTPDHLIFTKNRGWIEAQNLDENDILDLI